MNDKEKIRDLELTIKNLREDAESKLPNFHGNIPVFFKDKIFIVQLRSDNSAAFSGLLKGSVIAECDDSDNAAYILDFIN